MSGLLPAGLDVSRETIDRLKIFADLLEKWNPKINLVAPSTIPILWTRHFADSLQLCELGHPLESWADLGSGGGFPGLVVAIARAERPGAAPVTLVESDIRKCVFLRTVARETGISVVVINDRIERVAPLAAHTLSARALSALDDLLAHAERHVAPGGVCLFQKGASWKKEVEEARQHWRFDMEAISSLTEPDAVILRIEGATRG